MNFKFRKKTKVRENDNNPILKIIDEASEILAKTNVDADFKPIYINTKYSDGNLYVTDVSLCFERYNNSTRLILNVYHLPDPYRGCILLKYGNGKELTDYLADKEAVEAEIRELIPRLASGLKENMDDIRRD